MTPKKVLSKMKQVILTEDHPTVAATFSRKSLLARPSCLNYVGDEA